MKIHCRIGIALVAALLFAPVARASVTTTNPILFVTQVQMPRENNGAVATSFLSVVSLFGNHLPDTAHCGRGGDLWLRTTNGALVNLTRRAGFGTNDVQDSVGIAVRDPAIHWGGKKAIFSMVVGAPASSNDVTQFHWQLYEVTNLTAIIADTNTMPAIVPVPNQPTNFNNVNPTYATDDRVIFMTDKPIAAAAQIYPQLEEYRGQPSVTGTWSLDPATGNLRQLNHTPSGAFNPFVDSFGRIIETRWDHLVQDANSADDRLHNQTNGVFNFVSEALGASNVPVTLEMFPEPRNFDTTNRVAMGVNGNAFNNFFPWMLPEAGGEEEIINHLGRHEFAASMVNSFFGDTNLLAFSNLTSRATAGVVSANTNFIENFFQIVEDPRTNGVYFGVDAPDFSPTGGSHTSGRILTLTGPQSLNPNSMIFNRITTGGSTTLNYRNPLPMSDGQLIAVVTPASGFDTNLGTTSLPKSTYNFRLMLLTNNPSATIYVTNQFLINTPLTNAAVYWDGTLRVTNNNALWELQPVEVRSRFVPAPWNPGVASIEATVFTNANVDLATFQADLANRGLALVVSRNVTARDGNDKQQPYNLRIPGGTNSIANGGKTYDISHLQFMQSDYLRGYTNGQGGLPQPGRRILATPMHDSGSFNYVSAQTNAPIGGTELMPDGSQATIVPANRAVTWQLTGTNNNDSVVKERYWITFRPGEVRTCANCHGINTADQLGRSAPTNAPLALQKLLQLWRTNSANAYSLTVSNGSGSGSFGAGSIVTLTANAAPSGKLFAGWTGASVTSPNAATTSFIMPTNDATVIALFTNLPAPVFTSSILSVSNTLALSASAAANQSWVLEASPDLLNWIPVSTNLANGVGQLQLVVPVNAAPAQQFFRLRSP